MRPLFALSLVVAVATSASGQTYTMQTVAGGALPVNIPGPSASLGTVNGVTVDTAGNAFIVVGNYHVVLRIDAASGTVTLAAGNGIPGYSGDNGPATSAQLNYPQGVAVDASGNLYIADSNNNRIRKVSGGVITTVAGDGNFGYNGDGMPATDAWLNGPNGLTVDSAGTIFIADTGNGRIRKVSGGSIATVAGNGGFGYNGDNIAATSAEFTSPSGVAVDSAGNLYIADLGNHRVRKVSAGMITTVAGTGTPGYNGGSIPAASAELDGPWGVAVDASGNLYIADTDNNRIRKVAGGVITTVAGDAGFGYAGDNVAATSTSLYAPFGVALDASGNLYIADTVNYRLRKVSGGIITTLAGGGAPVGQNGPAINAQLESPMGIAVDPSGNLYIADSVASRVFEVSAGIIGVAAGNGINGFGGDGGPPTSANLAGPMGVAVSSSGQLYIADFINECIWEVSGGVITTVAGNGTIYDSGDNGPAVNAGLGGPVGGAVDSSGNLYIVDNSSSTIREISNGTITTVAGNGTQGYGGDGGPSTHAELYTPWGIAVDSSGNIYIADTYNDRIRKVSNGVITTVAGTGVEGYNGDGGPATSALLSQPEGVAVDSSGNLYIADSGNGRVRKVSGGVIATIAGPGTNQCAGPTSVAPSGMALDLQGDVYVSDVNSHRVCMMVPSGPSCAYAVSPLAFTADSSGGNFTANIQTTSGCQWAVQGLPDWITLSRNAVSSGPATVTLAVAPGAGGGRAAAVSIAGLSVRVTQTGTGLSPALNPGGVVNAASYAAVPRCSPASPGCLSSLETPPKRPCSSLQPGR
jgi:sugar lactone lactonase YvrE